MAVKHLHGKVTIVSKPGKSYVLKVELFLKKNIWQPSLQE